MFRTVTCLAAAAVFAVLSATPANALTIKQIISGEGALDPIPHSAVRPIVFEDRNLSIFLEDDGSVASDPSDAAYILTVAEFQSVTANATTIDVVPFSFDSSNGTTTGLIPTPPVNVLGNGTTSDTAIQAVLFGRIIGTTGDLSGDGTIEIGAASVASFATGPAMGVDLSAFTGGVMAQVFRQDDALASDTLAGSDVSDDIDNVRGGTEIATFGRKGVGTEFYTLVVQNGQISDFGISLSLFTNTSSIPIGVNNLGTHLFAEGGDFSTLGSASEWQSQGDGDAALIAIPTPAALPAGLALLGLATVRRRRVL